MDFLLDEKNRKLLELRIDETSASKAEAWQIGASLPGAPDDLASFLGRQHSQPIRIFVQDRMLCDATRKKSSKDMVAEYRAYRIAIFNPKLSRITPLCNQERPYKPMDEPNSFSVCAYGVKHVESVWMYPPLDELNRESPHGWRVSRSEIDAALRLDCWYYQDRFRKLRSDRKHWGTPTFGDLFVVSDERGKRKPLLERPCNGALRWLSSAQINERLHAISHSRIRGVWGQVGRDTPIKPGDFLISMLGFTEVKLARYDGPPDDATRSIYLLQFSQKQARSERDSAAVWFALTCDDFIDQLRMELSDRVMKPLTEHFFQGDIHLPPLPGGVTSGMALALDAMTRLALGGEDKGEVDSNLRNVEEALMAEDVTWPGKWSCLRRIARYRNSSDKNGKVVVLSNDRTIGRECVFALRKGNIQVAEPRLFSISGIGLESRVAKELSIAPAVISITSAATPLKFATEQLGAAQALDIVGESHIFALYAEKGEARDFPARQFLEHLFSETEREPESIDLNDETMTMLVQHVRSLLENQAVIACDEVIDRLAQLDSPSEPFVRFSPASAMASILDRIRPDLIRLSGRLKTSGATKGTTAANVISTRKSRRPHSFGNFVTYDEALAKKIGELVSVYGRALELTRNGSYPVIALLIEGETGCGKDALINYLDTQHPQSKFLPFGVTADKKFILSQLFGHAKGSYTGADKPRDGIFGTAMKEHRPVFLNEINSYSLEVQFRLLTVIEHGEFSPLGSEEQESLKYAGVVLAASNKPISALVADGSFRVDLQMRLGSPILIPPLRERPQDIECIFERINRDLAKNERTMQIGLDSSAQQRLLRYSWPGNARELQSLILRACLLGKSVIDNGFLEENFPYIYFGDIQDGKDARNDQEVLVPQELKHLESIFEIQGITKQQQYAKLMERLTGKKAKSNELPDWVRSRQHKIEQFKSELPLVNLYLEKLTAR
ncbi:MAG: sigma 54-interacting transcriptional regulator [Gallionellaceae bacterium]